MRLFLDTSILIAASISSIGASREIFNRARANQWSLISTPYVLSEVVANLHRFPSAATSEWLILSPSLTVANDILSVDRPAVFGPSKDRPILFSALAWADVLLTLDQADFGGLMGKPFYGLRVMRPAMWLHEQRASGPLL